MGKIDNASKLLKNTLKDIPKQVCENVLKKEDFYD